MHSSSPKNRETQPIYLDIGGCREKGTPSSIARVLKNSPAGFFEKAILYFDCGRGGMADAVDLKSTTERCKGSNPLARTKCALSSAG